MSKTYEVKTAAVINNNPVGSVIELPKKDADRFSNMGYVEIVKEIKPKKKTKPKDEAVPEKPVTKDSAPKTKDK